MSDARETAQRLSEGINCMAEIVETLKSDASPSLRPNWLAATEAMERAMETVRANEVTTSMVVTDELVARVRQVHLAILHWQGTGQPPQDLRALASGILRSFKL